MRVRVLGPVEVVGAGGPVRGLERKARELLAVLALRAPHAIGIDELVATLWDEPPPSAVKTVQAHLSRLRAALATPTAPTGGLERTGSSYRLRVEHGETDVAAVEEQRRFARELRADGRHDEAAGLLDEARRWWRGEVELPATVGGAALAARCLHDRQQLALEHLAAVVAGRGPGDAVPELRARTTADPLAEPEWALLVTALGRAGQRSAGLRAFQAARAALADVGLEPGPALRAAEQAVLVDPPTATPAAAPVDGRGPPPHAATPATVRYAAVGDPSHQVAYAVHGEARPRVLLLNPGHVSIDGVADEPRLAAAVAALAALGGLVTFDREGMGLSDRGQDSEAAGVESWADDAAAVLTATGADRPVVVANADSCQVALALAARRPDAVSALVLVHPYARYVRAADYPYGFDPATASAMSDDVLALDDRAARFDPLSHIAPSVAADPAFRAWWDALGRRAASPAAAAALHRAIFETDVRSLLPAVAAPTVLVHRRSSASYDVGHLHHLAATLAAARTATLPGADELWFVGDVDALVDLVVGVVDDVSPRG